MVLVLGMAASSCLAAGGGVTTEERTAPGASAVSTSPSPGAAGSEPAVEWWARGYRGEPAAAIPRRWVGVVREAPAVDRVVATVDGEVDRVVAWRVEAGSEGPAVRAETISIDGSDGLWWIGTCCEPVSGSLWTIDPASPDAPMLRADGLRTDAGGDVRAVVSATGDLAIYRRDSLELLEFSLGIGATSVAVDPAGVVVALTDDPSLLEHPSASGMRLRWYRLDASGVERRSLSLPAGLRFCAATWTHTGHVLLRARERSVEGRCLGSTLYDLDPVTGTLGEVDGQPGAPIAAWGIDASGSKLIYVTEAGEVRWRSLDDGTDDLLDVGAYVAADW